MFGTLSYLWFFNVFLLTFYSRYTQSANKSKKLLMISNDYIPKWVINLPSNFVLSSLANSTTNDIGKLFDARNDELKMSIFWGKFYESMLRIDEYNLAYTDVEVRDAIEHFFWGQMNGIALEMGALDGSLDTGSMTYLYEELFQWKRVLIEGDSTHRTAMKEKSPLALSINTCISQTDKLYHYGIQGMVGGLIEFMSLSFLELFYSQLLDTTEPRGNLSSANWSVINYQIVKCIPLKRILKKFHLTHINYFILDVEGSELDVLYSIDWSYTTFDILCIETEARLRLENYPEKVELFLIEKGYSLISKSQGRNSWYRNNKFVPISKPGLNVERCWNGAQRIAFNETC